MLTKSTPYLLPLAGVGMADYQRVGRKAAVLGELAQAGLPTPLGFCLSVAAFDRFVRASGNPAQAKSDPATLSILEKTSIPTDISEAILRVWDKLGSDQPYAVRLSPLQPLPESNAAFLNVRGPDALFDSIRRCWLTFLELTNQPTKHSINYQIGTAVLIQPMHATSQSGTLYTADPNSGSRHVAAIDAGYGLAASAMLQRLDKRTGEPIKAAHGFHAPLLPQEKAQLLVELGKQVETQLGQPQAISWLQDENGRFYLLNAKPLENLYPLPATARPNNETRIFLNLHSLEGISDPMPVMAHSIWRIMWPLSKSGSRVTESSMLASAGGRLFLDLTDFLGNRHSRLLLTRLLHHQNPQLLSGLRDLLKKNRLKPKSRPLRRHLFPLFADALADLFWREPEGVSVAIHQWTADYMRTLQQDLTAVSPGGQRLRFLRNALAQAYGETIRPILATVLAGHGAERLLARLVKPYADPEDLALFQRGLPSRSTDAVNITLADLATTLHASPTLLHHLQTQPPETALETIDRLEDGPQFLLRWAEFLLRFGMFGEQRLDISQPRWQEKPTPLIRRLQRQLDQPQLHPLRQHQQLSRISEAAADRLLLAARQGVLGGARQRLVGRLLQVVQHAALAQQQLERVLHRLLILVRQILLIEGKRLTANGRLQAPTDAWHLSLTELIQASDDPTLLLQPRIAKRQAELLQYTHLRAPNLMTSLGDVPTTQQAQATLPDGALTGKTVVSGICEGRARVITNPYTELVAPGEIVIAPFADPSLAPLYSQAAGVVTEQGSDGFGQETAVREFGIPILSNVHNATAAIKTGQLIRVHGDLGYVEILP